MNKTVDIAQKSNHESLQFFLSAHHSNLMATHLIIHEKYLLLNFGHLFPFFVGVLEILYLSEYILHFAMSEYLSPFHFCS